MSKRNPKLKAVSYELILRDSIAGQPMYELLDNLVRAHHDEIRDARIGLAWCTSWKPDVDGRVTLGKCRKATELDRELAAFDFVILLRRVFWIDERVTPGQRAALLDHELCHARRKHDNSGEPVVDERDRPVYRTRGHDIEEFTEVIERHGCYKADIERFAMALRQMGVPEFSPCEKCTNSPGWVYVENLLGARAVTRCECFLNWQQRRAEQAVA